MSKNILVDCRTLHLHSHGEGPGSLKGAVIALPGDIFTNLEELKGDKRVQYLINYLEKNKGENIQFIEYYPRRECKSMCDITNITPVQLGITMVEDYLPKGVQPIIQKHTEFTIPVNVWSKLTSLVYDKNTEQAGVLLNTHGDGVLAIKPGSLLEGETDSVDVVPGLYNFHTHPKTTYEKYDVLYAWPSAQDYIGYLLSMCQDGTRVHIVVGVEGMYIISLVKPIMLSKNVIDFVEDNYGFCYKPGNTPEWYVKKVKKLLYPETGFPLFNLEYYKKCPRGGLLFSAMEVEQVN
jgi:hypothetical protein